MEGESRGRDGDDEGSGEGMGIVIEMNGLLHLL